MGSAGPLLLPAFITQDISLPNQLAHVNDSSILISNTYGFGLYVYYHIIIVSLHWKSFPSPILVVLSVDQTKVTLKTDDTLWFIDLAI